MEGTSCVALGDHRLTIHRPHIHAAPDGVVADGGCAEDTLTVTGGKHGDAACLLLRPLGKQLEPPLSAPPGPAVPARPFREVARPRPPAAPGRGRPGGRPGRGPPS